MAAAGAGWRSTALTQRLGLRVPIVLAPMAGVSTPALVGAVADAGGLGLYGAALTPPGELAGIVAAVRAQQRTPSGPGSFGFNLFLPPPDMPEHTALQRRALEDVHAFYAAQAAALGLECAIRQQPPPDLHALRANFDAQLQALLDARVPVISFYFGVPSQEVLDAVRSAGALSMGTATCLEEALALEAAGVDVIVAQGGEAGGHRGTWYTTPGGWRRHMYGTGTLISLLARHIKQTPLVAAGGIMDGAAVVAALAAGAAGAALGTAFLTTREAGTSQLGRRLLLTEPQRGTVVTQAFTGKPARGLHNQAAEALGSVQDQLPASAYGLVNARPFFAAAAAAGLGEHCMQLCGQGYPSCRECSAAELMQQLEDEADAAVARLSGSGQL